MTQRVAGHLLRDRHHLLLVHDQAVGGVQDLRERFFQFRVDGCDFLRTVLPQRVIGVRVGAHGPRTVQRDGRGNVLEVVRAHELEQLAHGATVQLEHSQGLAAGQQIVGLLVVHVQVLQIEHETVTVEGDVLECVRDDREVPQPQEVHLDQAQALTRGVVELRDHLAVLLTAHQRNDVDERVRGHDHTGRVHTPLAFEPLQTLGGFEDLHGLRIIGQGVAKLTGFVVAFGVLVVDVLE